MAELSTLARPYARAAFEYALEHNTLDSWSQALSSAAEVSRDERVAAILASPAHTASHLAEMLLSLCGDDFGKEQQNFIHVLSANKRLPLLAEISLLFNKLKSEQEKTVDVTVVSAFELEDSARQSLAQVLSKKLAREVNVETKVDASLLGGVLIRAGDMVIDGSVRGRLNKLAEAMNS
jgi:F-type H+-transporting ATPase subunit delta